MKCSVCKKEKDISEFEINNKTKAYKKSCTKCLIYKRNYNKTNGEELAKKQREYYQNNKEAQLEYRHNYYSKNKDEIAHKEKIKYIDNRATSIEFIIKNKIKGNKGSDNRYNRTFELTYEEARDLLLKSEGKCVYCKRICKLTDFKPYDMTQFTFDRKNNNLGHSKSNCVISCLQDNMNRNIGYNHSDYLIDMELYGN